MKYLVDVNGARVEVMLDADGVTVDGTREMAHLADVEGTPVRLVTIGGAQHRVIARRSGARGSYALLYEIVAVSERATNRFIPADFVDVPTDVDSVATVIVVRL